MFHERCLAASGEGELWEGRLIQRPSFPLWVAGLLSSYVSLQAGGLVQLLHGVCSSSFLCDPEWLWCEYTLCSTTLETMTS